MPGLVRYDLLDNTFQCEVDDKVDHFCILVTSLFLTSWSSVCSHEGNETDQDANMYTFNKSEQIL